MGQEKANLRPVTQRRLNIGTAVEQLQTIAHAIQPIAGALFARQYRHIEALTVIFYDDRQPFGFLLKNQNCFLHPGMFDHVKQQFPHNLVQQNAQLFTNGLRLANNVVGDVQAVKFLHMSGQPAQHFRQFLFV